MGTITPASRHPLRRRTLLAKANQTNTLAVGGQGTAPVQAALERLGDNTQDMAVTILTISMAQVATHPLPTTSNLSPSCRREHRQEVQRL